MIGGGEDNEWAVLELKADSVCKNGETASATIPAPRTPSDSGLCIGCNALQIVPSVCLVKATV